MDGKLVLDSKAESELRGDVHRPRKPRALLGVCALACRLKHRPDIGSAVAADRANETLFSRRYRAIRPGIT